MNILKHIPDTITSMNLLCGSAGVICAFGGNLDAAFYLMLAAAVCDFFDGFAARMLDAHSPIGKELDSLADLISFGLLPAMMMHCLMVEMKGEMEVWSFIPLVLVVFAALRLANFNIDDRQSENFIGLPAPSSAMICGSLVYYIMNSPAGMLMELSHGPVFIPVVSVVLSLLMVSGIPMFSMKFKKGMPNDSPIRKMRIGFIGIVCVLIVLIPLLGLNWSMIVLMSFIIYIVMNIINYIASI